MNVKKLISLLLIFLLTMSTVYADYESDLKDLIINNSRDDYIGELCMSIGSYELKLGDKTVQLLSAPILYEGNTLVNPEDISGYFGMDFIENNEEIMFVSGCVTAIGRVGSNRIVIYVNNEFNGDVLLSCNIIRNGNIIYVPLRSLVQDIFAGDVYWYATRQEIVLQRSYQSRRIIVNVKGSASLVEAVEAKEKLVNKDGIWIIQFDPNTPEILIKRICARLSADSENIKYAIPDIVL